MKKTLFFLAAATFAAVGMAQTPTFEVTTQNGAVLLMSVVDGEATVTGGKLTTGTECNLGDLVIPATVEHDGNTVPVTTIGAAAFNHDTNESTAFLTLATIPLAFEPLPLLLAMPVSLVAFKQYSSGVQICRLNSVDAWHTDCQ